MKVIEPIIMNTAFERIGTVDTYSSLMWISRFYTCGAFEICVDICEKNMELLKIDYYVMRDDDENVGIIEKIELQANEDQHEIAIVSGRFLPSILSRRIIAVQTQVNGTVSDGIYRLISDAIISPTLESRKIPNFILGTTQFTERLVAQYTGRNLLSTVEEICETHHIGHKTTLTDDNKFIFTLYTGTDRSYNQTKNPYVIFSDVYDNLAATKWIENHMDVITDVLVAGEGEGINRKTLWVTRENKIGLDRREFFQDQRNMSTNDGEISMTDYEKQLREEGLENITSFVSAFEGVTYFDNIEYNKDVFLGDICVIENTRWNIHINSRLVEVIESVDEAGDYSINPTFGI